MGSILLSLGDIVFYDGQCKVIFENPSDVHFATTFISKHRFMFINNKNSFQPVNNHNDTSAITIPTTIQRRKQPHRQLVPESEKMKKKAKTQKKSRQLSQQQQKTHHLSKHLLIYIFLPKQGNMQSHKMLWVLW